MAAEPPRSLDHPERAGLLAETHARPTLPVNRPCVLYHEAFVHSDGGRQARAFMEAFCLSQGITPPAANADFHIATLPSALVKWERHGEFCSWTRIAAPGAPPPPWPDGPPPGARASAARIVISEERGTFAALPGNEHAASEVSGGTSRVWTDLAMRPDGFVQYTLETAFEGESALGPARLGRLVRRLCEIETYRLLALLAFPLARSVRGQLDRLDHVVSGAFAEGAGADGEVLTRLTDAARDVERLLTETDFRFGAGAAYRKLVETRIGELREGRIDGQQRLGRFLERRFAPAMDTVASTKGRLESLASRIERACALLRTRVDLSLQEQNQTLLRSMDERARLQLRLQETVEGFSIVAISYYAVMLLSKMLHGAMEAAAQRLGVGVGWFDTALVLVVGVAVAASVQGMKKRLRGA